MLRPEPAMSTEHCALRALLREEEEMVQVLQSSLVMRMQEYKKTHMLMYKEDGGILNTSSRKLMNQYERLKESQAPDIFFYY